MTGITLENLTKKLMKVYALVILQIIGLIEFLTNINLFLWNLFMLFFMPKQQSSNDQEEPSSSKERKE